MKKAIIIPITLLLCLCLCSCKDTALSIEKNTNKYERILSELHKRGQFNGNALILENGEIAFQGAFGIRSIDPLDSLNLNTAFRLGSISKTFTSAAIMILNEQGKLSYDQDVREFLPELPYEGITIRNLLNHTSGIPDYMELMDTHWKRDLDFENPEKAISGNEDILKMLVEFQPPLLFKPMEKWEYSNTGYVLLAIIVSRVSQSSFADFLAENIFKPAGMDNTCVYRYVQGPDINMPNRAFGFSEGLLGKLTWVDYHYLNHAQGDGGIYSTLGDLLNWDRILYTDKIVSEETKREAFTPAVLTDGSETPYGFGWFIEESSAGKRVVQHSGGWVGFINHFYREIDADNCIILLTNNSSFNNTQDLLIKVMQNQPFEMPKIKGFKKVGDLAMTQGADAAIDLYKVMKSDSSDYYIIDERQMNVIGYELLNADRVEDALKVFKLNIEENPNSANAYDSYGDGLLKIGDTLNALLNFKRTVELDSSFWIAKEKITKLSKVKK